MPTTVVSAAEIESRLTPVEGRAVAVAEQTDEGWTVAVTFECPVDTDRSGGYGWSLRPTHARLAQRLVRAVNDQRVFSDFRLGTDIHGKTYITATSGVLGRTLNADLSRMGY